MGVISRNSPRWLSPSWRVGVRYSKLSIIVDSEVIQGTLHRRCVIFRIAGFWVRVLVRLVQLSLLTRFIRLCRILWAAFIDGSFVAMGRVPFVVSGLIGVL